MNATLINSGYTASYIQLDIWVFALYLVLAFLIGYVVHYIFSSRRTYVRTPRSHPKNQSYHTHR